MTDPKLKMARFPHIAALILYWFFPNRGVVELIWKLFEAHPPACNLSRIGAFPQLLGVFRSPQVCKPWSCCSSSKGVLEHL